MKETRKDLNDEALTRFFQDETPLPDIPERARRRVMEFVRKQAPEAPGPAKSRVSRRAILWPALGLTAAAVIVVGFLAVLPALRKGGGETIAERRTVTEQDLARGVIETAADRALLVYFSGRVEVSFRDAWEPAAIGAFLGRGQRLKVGSSSSCRLQFGDRAIVQVGENTELSIDELVAAAGRTDIELGLESGSALCKVARLTGAETFQVRTKSAACGVRGTEFGVEVTGTQDTVVSVREGVVYALPPGADLGTWRKRLAAADPRLRERLDALKSSAPAVTAGRELTLPAGFPSAAETEASALEAELNRASSLGAPTAKDVARLDSSIGAFASSLSRKVPPSRTLAPERGKALASIHEAAFLPVTLTGPETAPAPAPTEKPAGPALVKIELTTVPDDASIILSGREAGRGRYLAIVDEGVRLEFTVRREGYEDASVVMTAAAAGPNNARVELKKLPAQPGPQTTSPAPNETSGSRNASPSPTSTAAAKKTRRLGAPFVFLAEYMGHEYYLYRQMLSWNNAIDLCAKNGGHLVTITSAAEYEAITNGLRGQNMRDASWIGFTKQRSAEWKWVTGEKSAYTHWGSGQPDNANGNQVLAVMGGYGAITDWNDVPDDELHYVILELEPAAPEKAKAVLPQNDQQAVDFFDDFNGEQLDGRWRWVREKPASWSVKAKAGYLMIKAENGDLEGSYNNNRNMLLTDVSAGDFTIETRIEFFQPDTFAQQAGLIVYRDDDNYVRLTHVFSEGEKIEMSNEIRGQINYERRGVGSAVVLLRLTKKGDSYSGFFSLDGKAYAPCGSFTNNLGGSLKVGLIAFNTQAPASLPAYFAYFRMTYDH
jgi:regulation of enolase protein 1 (concanavalin A-like superfamily)